VAVSNCVEQSSLYVQLCLQDYAQLAETFLSGYSDARI